jgi:FixJ family two-component response regulator
MSAGIFHRTILVVDDDHDYKAALARNLTEFDVRFWGCRALKCKICNADQPFADAIGFARALEADPKATGRLVAIVLDVNEFSNDECSINRILPALQNAAQLNTVPVIVYSAKHLPEMEMRAKRAGAIVFYDRAMSTPKQAAEIIRKYALP